MSGASRLVTGTVKGTGAALAVEVGFKPRLVVVDNITDNIQLKHQQGMPDASGIKTVAAGTRTYVSSNGITPSATGFTLGTDSVNGSDDTLHWAAWD